MRARKSYIYKSRIIFLILVFILTIVSLLVFNSKSKAGLANATEVTASNGFTYLDTETKFFVDGEDRTDDIKANGFRCVAGDNTTIKIEVSGYKFNKSDSKDAMQFKYYVDQMGKIQWDAFMGSYYAQQNREHDCIASGPVFYDSNPDYPRPFTDSSGSRYYTSFSCSGLGNPNTRNLKNSKYTYERSMLFFTKPSYSVVLNKDNSETTVKNIYNTPTTTEKISKRTTQEYVGKTTSESSKPKGYWSSIATSYEQLGDHSHNANRPNSQNSFNPQWNDADTAAYNELTFDKIYNIFEERKKNDLTNHLKFKVSYNLNIADVKDYQNDVKYQLSVDDGAIKSEPLELHISKATENDKLQYDSTDTKFFLKNKDGTYEDKTDDLKQNGYLGKIGENTKLKIQMSGLKYKQNKFSGEVVGDGGKIHWGDYYVCQHYDHGDNYTGLAGVSTKKFDDSRYYSYCYSTACNANISMTISIRATAHSRYNYLRELSFYNSPYSAVNINNKYSKKITSGDNSKIEQKSKTHQQQYNTFCNIWGCANGYWDCIAESYDDLVTHRRTNFTLDFMRGVPQTYRPPKLTSSPCFPSRGNLYGYPSGDSIIQNAEEDWIDADNNAKQKLSIQSLINGDNNCYYSKSYELDTSDIDDPINKAGKYQISIDSGKAKSEPLNICMYEVVDNKPLYMGEASSQGSVSSNTTKIRLYNPNETSMTVSTGVAKANLDGEALKLKESNYFTSSNVDKFGSNVAMKEIEAYVSGSKNLNTSHDNIATIPAKGYKDVEVKIKNANAIFKNADGSIKIPVKLDLGNGSSINREVEVGINAQVAQIKVSVPMEIKMYVAEDLSRNDKTKGRQTFSNLNGNTIKENDIDGNFVQNFSNFPVDVSVSPFLVTQATSIKDADNNDYYPDLNNKFNINLKAVENDNSIKLLSKSNSSGDMQYTNFATMKSNGDKSHFYFTMDGKISDQFKSGEYKYKLIFNFSPKK